MIFLPNYAVKELWMVFFVGKTFTEEHVMHFATAISHLQSNSVAFYGSMHHVAFLGTNFLSW